MPRLRRYELTDLPQHVVQRGNNRQPTFFADADYVFYLECLRDAAKRYGCEIHAYVLMTNHIHLLVTPRKPLAIAKLLQSVGRRYVRYINYEYRRSGTLWEGRYKASLVNTQEYFLSCSRYIETNPVRADMVVDPRDYPWSSYRSNAWGEPSTLLTPHSEYTNLGSSEEERCRTYRELFRADLEASALQEIRDSVNQSRPLGSKRFQEQIEETLKRRLQPGKPGPKKKGKGDNTESTQEMQRQLLL